MDLNQLALFVRVVDSGSFTRAARSLRQPKSRVSRNVAALERELGVTLLYRTTRQFSPTEEGRALYSRARSHVYELESAAQALGEGAGEAAGTLRVTAAEDLGSVLLGPLIGSLARKHPKLSVELHLSNEVVDLVKEGIDIAIRIGELEDASLKARSLGRVAFALVASPAYLKAAPRIEKLADLAEHPALVFHTEEGDDVWRLRSGAGRPVALRPKALCRANNPKVLLDLALSGDGVALIPEFLCVDSLRTGALRRVLDARGDDVVPIHFVWPAHREASPRIRAFVDEGLRALGKYFSG